MRILVVSDVHEDESSVKSLSETFSPDAILDCGDHTCNLADMYDAIPRYFIYGNHATDDIRNLAEKNVAYSKGNLHYLPSGCLSTITVANESLNVAAIAGNISKNDSILSLNSHHLESLRDDRRVVDILLCHDSIPQIGLRDDMDNSLAKDLEHVIEMKSPRFGFSGHIHKYRELATPDSYFVSLSYPIITAGLLEGSKSNLAYKRLLQGKDYDAPTKNWSLVSKQLHALKKELKEGY